MLGKFRIPELFLGIILAVAVFESGFVFASLTQTQTTTTSAAQEPSSELATPGADDRIADYTLWLMVFTGALGVATIGLWFTTYIGIRNQSRDIRVLQRAYLAIESGGIDPLLRNDTSVVHISVVNVGHLPAREVEWCINVEMDGNGARSDFPVNGPFYGNNTIPPGTEMRRSQNAEFKEVDFANFVGRRLHLYVWGEVRYRDGFGDRRFTKFCHRYGGSGAILYGGNNNRASLTAEGMRFHRYGNNAD